MPWVCLRFVIVAFPDHTRKYFSFKFGTLLFLFSNKMMAIRAGIHKLLVNKQGRGRFGRLLVFEILEH